MHGASRVLALYDSALCVRGFDGAVFTTDENTGKQAALSADGRRKEIQVVRQGEGVFA